MRPRTLLIAGLVLLAGGTGIMLGFVTKTVDCDCRPCMAMAGDSVENARAAHPAGRMPVARDHRTPAVPCDPKELQRIRDRIDEIRTKTAFSERLSDGYVATQEGVPIPWTDDIPLQYRAEQFQAIIAQALDELQAPAEIVGFDCNEPPCIVKLRVLDGSNIKINKSDAWRKNFRGRTATLVNVDCKDGRFERINLFAPSWDGKTDPAGLTEEENKKIRKAAIRRMIDGTETEEEKARDKRLSHRLSTIRESWQCAPADRREP